MARHALLVAVLAAGCTASDVLVLSDVHVVDVENGVLLPGRTVVVAGDRIRAIEDDFTAAPRGAQHLDGAGCYLIPGLWDMHVHDVAVKTNLPFFLAHGVTGVRDMGGDPEGVLDVRERIERGELRGPTVVAAGPFVDGPKDAAHRLVVETAEDGRRAVRELEALGVDFIKVHSNVSPEAYFALADEARARGIAFAGHVPRGMSWVEAAEAGAASLEHALTLGEQALTREALESDEAFERRMTEYLGGRGAELTAALREHGTAICPTLVGGEAIAVGSPDFVAERRAVNRAAKRIVAALHDAGVTILAGTDTGIEGVPPGESLLDELALLVEAGLTPAEALRTATLAPARFLGRDDVGRVSVGRRADLVLLDANPLEDVTSLRRIRAVVVGGELLTSAHGTARAAIPDR